MAGQGQRPARVAQRSFRSQCRRKYNANYFGYANPSYDKLIEEADTSHDRKARKDAVVKLQRFLSEDAVCVWLFSTDGIVAMRQDVYDDHRDSSVATSFLRSSAE